jgi:bacteriocin biosynthesis cyclodehydratase domain-containing protein
VFPAQGEIVRRQSLFWGRKLGLTRSAKSESEVRRRLETTRLVLIGTGLFGAATYELLFRSGISNIRVLAWDDDGLLLEALTKGPQPPRQFIGLTSTSTEEAHGPLRLLVEEADLVVAATRDAPAQFFQLVNRICLDRSCAWLRANDDGCFLEIGPYMLPYDSACYRCLQLRRASVQDFAVEEELFQQHLAENRPPGQTLPKGEALAVANLAASLIALEVMRIVTGVAVPALLNAVLTVDPLRGTFESNRILRVPRCPECFRGAMVPQVEAATDAQTGR